MNQILMNIKRIKSRWRKISALMQLIQDTDTWVVWVRSSNNQMLIRQIKTAQKALGRRHRLIDESAGFAGTIEVQKLHEEGIPYPSEIRKTF